MAWSDSSVWRHSRSPASLEARQELEVAGLRATGDVGGDGELASLLAAGPRSRWVSASSSACRPPSAAVAAWFLGHEIGQMRLGVGQLPPRVMHRGVGLMHREGVGRAQREGEGDGEPEQQGANQPPDSRNSSVVGLASIDRRCLARAAQTRLS